MRPDPNRRRKQSSTGLCQVYISWSEGFSGRLRPAHDTAPDCSAPLTARQVRTLRDMIGRYLTRCREANASKEGATDAT